jgi:MSHA pilin protein MshD
MSTNRPASRLMELLAIRLGRQTTPAKSLVIPFSISRQSGISLIELIMFIVIVSVALAGIMLVINQITRNSADTLLGKQALAVAESKLEEIEAQSFSNIATAVASVNGTSAPGLTGYSVVSAVLDTSVWNGLPAGKTAKITVTVTDPGGNAYDATGYRTAY